jgi:hypothetical protein
LCCPHQYTLVGIFPIAVGGTLRIARSAMRFVGYECCFWHFVIADQPLIGQSRLVQGAPAASRSMQTTQLASSSTSPSSMIAPQMPTSSTQQIQ